MRDLFEYAEIRRLLYPRAGQRAAPQESRRLMACCNHSIWTWWHSVYARCCVRWPVIWRFCVLLSFWFRGNQHILNEKQLRNILPQQSPLQCHIYNPRHCRGSPAVTNNHLLIPVWFCTPLLQQPVSNSGVYKVQSETEASQRSVGNYMGLPTVDWE